MTTPTTPTTTTTLNINLTPGNTVVLDTKLIYQDPQNNPRKGYSDEGWALLVADLRTCGQLMPVTARIRCEHDGPESEGYLLVMENGHSRSKARTEMGVDRDETGRRAEDLSVTVKSSIEDRVLARLRLPGLSEGMETSELAKLKSQYVLEEKGKAAREAHSVNTAQEAWRCYDEANSLQLQLNILAQLNPDLPQRDLENQIGETNNMKGDLVRMRLSLLDEAKTPMDIQDKLRDGELSYSEAIELRRITDKEIREDLTEKTWAEGWSANQLKKKIDKKVAEASSQGVKIKATRTRSTKAVSTLRNEDDLTGCLQLLKETIEEVSEEEDELLNQLLGAVTAIEYVLTPSLTEEFLDVLDRKVEAYFEAETDGESEETSENTTPVE